MESVGGGLGTRNIEGIVGAVVGHSSGVDQIGVPEDRVGQGTGHQPGGNPPGQEPMAPFLRHGEPSRNFPSHPPVWPFYMGFTGWEAGKC